MVTGDGYRKSLFSCLSLSFSFWGMVAGDGYGKSLGDGYGRWLREVFVFLFFLIFLLSGGWLREMVTGSLCFPFFLDISPCGRWLREVWLREVYGRWLREMVTGSLRFPFDISPFGKWLREMATGDGYGKSLFSSFS